MEKEKTWIQIFSEAYPKARPIIALICVLAISTSSLFTDIKWRVTVLSVLGSALLLLVFDLFKSLNGRLDRIDTNLKEQEPPTFGSFTLALPEIKKHLFERLKENKDVEIKIIAVSAQFTWRILIEDTIIELMDIGNKNPKINIQLLIVQPEILRQWGQPKLRLDTLRTIDGYPLFFEKNKQFVANGRLQVSIYQYDNLPHWHGILIDNEILFMGRCKWNLEQPKKELLVGQKEYRLFRTRDRFRGIDRVSLFDNWFEAYKLRAMILDKQKNQEPQIEKYLMH